MLITACVSFLAGLAAGIALTMYMRSLKRPQREQAFEVMRSVLWAEGAGWTLANFRPEVWEQIKGDVWYANREGLPERLEHMLEPKVSRIEIARTVYGQQDPQHNVDNYIETLLS